jgi:hypothetical protein
MSWRHRHFSVLPARLANVVCDGSASARSQDRHGSAFATPSPQTRSTRLEQADYRLRRRHWIVAAGTVAPTTPMWTSRTSWTCEVAAWAASSAGRHMLRRVHLTQRLFTRVTAALARFADGSTGRHCAVTNARVARAAGCSPRTVTTVRGVLAAAEFAVEVRRGTGSASTPVHQRRPSVWHLTSRRLPVDEATFCDLPRSRRVTGSVPVGSTPPSAAHSAPQRDQSPRKRRQRRQEPRPLHTQRLAGWLASTSAGLGARTGHHVVGQLCNALQASHLELPAWTGPQLVEALNHDMKQRGATWPDQICCPGAFLAQRLRNLPARPPVPPISRPTTGHRAIEDTHPSPAPPQPPSAPSAARLEAQRRIRELLARKLRRAPTRTDNAHFPR